MCSTTPSCASSERASRGDESEAVVSKPQTRIHRRAMLSSALRLLAPCPPWVVQVPRRRLVRAASVRAAAAKASRRAQTPKRTPTTAMANTWCFTSAFTQQAPRPTRPQHALRRRQQRVVSVGPPARREARKASRVQTGANDRHARPPLPAPCRPALRRRIPSARSTTSYGARSAVSKRVRGDDGRKSKTPCAFVLSALGGTCRKPSSGSTPSMHGTHARSPPSATRQRQHATRDDGRR